VSKGGTICSKLNPRARPPASVAEDGLVLVNDRAGFETEIRLVRVGTESHPARRNFRQRFAGVDHRDVVGCLVLEDPQLRGAVFSHRAIAIEMIGREV